MVSKLQQLVTLGKLFGARLVLGGSVLVAATMIATAGTAAAQAPDPSITSGPANVTMCKNDFRHFDFDNIGQCVSWWNHHHGGHGYGNGHGHGHHHHHRFDFATLQRIFEFFFD